MPSSTKSFMCCMAALVFMLLVVLPAGAESERITLEVALTAGRNPDVNIVQDYGEESWADILAEEFKKEYPHVDVVFRVANLEQVAVMIASGIGPDIVNGAATAFVNLGRNGAFTNLRPLLDEEGVDLEKNAMYWPPQMQAFQYDGEIFALPQYLGTLAIQYNADLFAEAGIAEPDPHLESNTMDWDEFENIAKKLTRRSAGTDTTDVWGFHKDMGGNRVHYWQIAAGAQLYGNEEQSVSLLDSPEAVNALEYLQSLRWDSMVIPTPGTSVSGLWNQGRIAMSERGSWEMVRYLGRGSDGQPKLTFEWNVFPMPIGPSGDRASFATIDGYALNKNTQHPEEAYALLRFLAGPKANAILAKYLGLQPAHRDVVPEYIGLMQDLNRDVSEINMHVFTDAGPYAHPQFLYSQSDTATSILYDAYKRILDGNEPAGPVWYEAIERLNRMLASDDSDAVVEAIEWQGEQWLSRDFNTVVEGSAVVDADEKLNVSGAGADIWGTRDGFHFVYQEIRGDFTATVTLESVPNTDPWSKAGIIVRGALESNAVNAAVLGTKENGVVMQDRLFAGGSSRTAGRTAWDSDAPVYLRLTRRGDEITGFMSRDKTEWIELETVELDLSERVFVGLAVTSHASSRLGDAVFSAWQLTNE